MQPQFLMPLWMSDASKGPSITDQWPLNRFTTIWSEYASPSPTCYLLRPPTCKCKLSSPHRSVAFWPFPGQENHCFILRSESSRLAKGLFTYTYMGNSFSANPVRLLTTFLGKEERSLWPSRPLLLILVLAQLYDLTSTMSLSSPNKLSLIPMKSWTTTYSSYEIGATAAIEEKTFCLQSSDWKRGTHGKHTSPEFGGAQLWTTNA